MVYYIDPQNGSDSNAGTTPEMSWCTITGRVFEPGDQVLFRRGSVIRKALRLPGGSREGVITYGAYGDGPDPVVNPSVNAGKKELWTEERPGIWRFAGSLPGEMCNIVFNDGASFGNLRWSQEELKKPGEWYYTLLGHSMNEGEWERWGKGTLYLACDRNPADAWEQIELVHWGDRMVVEAEPYVVIENFTFEKSGVHGFSATRVHHVVIRHCTFRCIGGGVFDRKTKVRLGNAVEFWNGACDCTVEHCVFSDIYDSGVTHQGTYPESQVPARIRFCNNLFLRCGMAAYEWRGPASRDIVFENNICLYPGGPLSRQGEDGRRRTENERFNPMTGVSVLIWRLEQEIEPGEIYCTIRNNVFGQAPNDGGAISSGVDEAHMRRFVIEDNLYCQADGGTLIRMGTAPDPENTGKTWSAEQFAQYQQETGFDKDSRILDSGLFHG